MNAMFKKPAGEPSRAAEHIFVPAEAKASRSGKSKIIATRPRLPLRWPKVMKSRKEAFEAWHAVAMQVCNDADVSFRLMAVVRHFVHWNTGTFWATNATIARHAGYCSERTIKRDMVTYSALGIFNVEHGWRRGAGGKIVRSRLVRLSIPTDLPPETWIPNTDHGDNSCPHELLGVANDHGDNCCHHELDNCCPFTLGDTHDGGDGAA
jgi:hypothetical protein